MGRWDTDGAPDSLFRTGSKAPGIVAIIIGVVGSIGLFGLPLVLGEVVPGW